MKILVTVKRVPDPELRPKFKGDSLDTSAVTWTTNTFDEYAVETALRLIENAATGERAGEIVLLGIGPKETAAELRKGLAMGADRAILVEADEGELDSDVVARAVKAVVEKEQPDLLLMGKQATDGDSNQVGQIAAGLLGWPQATFAASIELGADGKSLTVGREVDQGVESKKIPLPGVVTVDLRIVTPKAVVNGKTPESHAYGEGARYPSLKGIMAAKKKPIVEHKLADLGVAAQPKVKWLSVEPPPARKAGVKVADVSELIKRLHDEAKVL